jgi:hypothetical protein
MFTSASIISSTILAASCTSFGVRSGPQDTANMILFALSRFVSINGLSIAFLAASTALFSPTQYPIPSKAFHEFCITVLISAKSTLIVPGFMIKSDIPLIPEYNI